MIMLLFCARRQRCLDYVALVPCNLYGPHDNFDERDSHVLPALVRKAHAAAAGGAPYRPLGTGNALRQFMHVGDFSRVILWAAVGGHEGGRDPRLLIVAPDEEHSIRELSDTVRWAVGEVTGAQIPETVWEESAAGDDGQRAKRVSNAALMRARPGTSFRPLREGVLDVVRWYAERVADGGGGVRGVEIDR